MKIALVVHGRFHAFDLARALISRGHDVTLFTNYPAWAVDRFGTPSPAVRTFPTHGALARASSRLRLDATTEPWLHTMFGRWVAREIAKESWDAIHCWSGVSEELLAGPRRTPLTLLMRGSAHISAQSRLLREEEVRAGVPLDRPSRWMTERERREYDLADKIVVLSTFAKRSFEVEGIHASKVAVLPLGVDVRAFRPSPEAIARRQQRLRSGAPLHVLFVGALSYQKGLLDLASAIDTLAAGPFRFTLVGPVTPEAAGVASRLKHRAAIVGKMAQQALPPVYEDADVFLFPTIQDGFGMVLTQAKAAGLPVLATTNCAALDLVTPGRDGWILPIRDVAAIVHQLRWCDAHRDEVARMTAEVYERFQPRDWMSVADDFEEICRRGAAVGEELTFAHD
jgi:glycosyltransferase involved in cell wall biosynthesis